MTSKLMGYPPFERKCPKKAPLMNILITFAGNPAPMHG